jgi:hypothetical protein
MLHGIHVGISPQIPWCIHIPINLIQYAIFFRNLHPWWILSLPGFQIISQATHAIGLVHFIQLVVKGSYLCGKIAGLTGIVTTYLFGVVVAGGQQIEYTEVE